MTPTADMFSTPLIPNPAIADPWVLAWEGYYYLTGTESSEDRLVVRAARTLTGLAEAQGIEVWQVESAGPRSAQVWAPEIHSFDGSFYVYFTAGDGRDESHRHYVLVGETPLGPYRDLGRVDPHFDGYAIDGSVMQVGDRLYWLYAAHDGLWAALMDGPARAGVRRTLIARGDQDWEHAWLRRDGGGWTRASDLYWIEAPQALQKGTRTFLAYSAGHSATPHYAMGLLECVGEVLDPAAWIKHPGPVFGPCSGEDGEVVTVGHASFTCSPDGTEDWIVYHAKDGAGDTFEGRTVRAQRFGWTPEGMPAFGRPIPSGVPQRRPSGE